MRPASSNPTPTPERDLDAERQARAELERAQSRRLVAALKDMVRRRLGKRDPRTGFYVDDDHRHDG